MVGIIQRGGSAGARAAEATPGEEGRAGVSKFKIALGAASLFLFIVGIKRSLRADDIPRDEHAHEDRSGARERMRGGA